MSTDAQTLLVGALIIATISIAIWCITKMIGHHLDDHIGHMVGDQLPPPKPLPKLSADVIKSMHIIRAGHAARHCKNCRECGSRCQGQCATRSVK